MIADDFNLEKELAQSKINININELYNTNKFLTTREWNYLDDNKIEYLENKVNMIYKEMDKHELINLKTQINKANFENFYNQYKFNEYKYRITCISSLNFLIESTYYGRKVDDDTKKLDFEQLNPLIEKFRNVKGDGECFYRGLIFSLLENIILTNNIMQMKELLILYYEKINKNNKLIKEKDYLKQINKMNISIVTESLYLIVSEMENNILNAYEILLKVFLFCTDFDYGIIFFTRYLIYEYILANENKIYSKEYQVEIGCLLPDDYIKDRGKKNEYFFENYYSLQLMNPKTFAEKIVLYVTPFVFNINMNILIYDYGINGALSHIEEKKFSNEKESNSQIQINLLFRKLHYDIYYKKKFYEENKNYLNILINKKENISFNNENQTTIKINKTYPTDNIKGNKEVKVIKEVNIIKHDDNINKKPEKDNLNYKYIDGSLCLECNKPYGNEENIFLLCDECLSNNLKSLICSAFFEFIRDKKNLINSEKKFKNFLSRKNCNITTQENMSIFEAIINTKFEFKELFLYVRSQICLYCGKQINDEDEFFIELPCKCRMCSKNCFIEYLSMMKKHIKLNEECNPSFVKYINILTCFCGFIYNTKNVLYMINQMTKHELKDQKKIYQEYIINIWNWRCFSCTTTFKNDKKFYRIYFKCEDIDINLLDSNAELKHLVCEECYNKYVVNKNKIIACNLCELKHEITQIKTVNEKNEDNSACLVF